MLSLFQLLQIHMYEWVVCFQVYLKLKLVTKNSAGGSNNINDGSAPLSVPVASMNNAPLNGMHSLFMLLITCMFPAMT